MNAPAVAPAPKVDPETIVTALRNLCDEGEVFEIRAPNYSDHPDGRYPSTVSGYFTDPDAAAREVAKFATAGTCEGWFATLNPVKPELLARAANKLKAKAKATTTDKEIVARTRMLVDIDVERPSGISSTAAELAKAQQAAADVRAYLDARGWPEPVVETMSGNGAALIYATALPADDGGLVARFLAALAFKFNTPADATGPRVKVDMSVHNPARITKLIGTTAGKGDNLVGVTGLEDRPHRMTRLVAVAESVVVVTRDAILAVVEEIEAGYPPTSPAPANRPAPPSGNGKRFATFPATPDGVANYLREHGADVQAVRGSKIMLGRCPVVPDCEAANGSDIAVLVPPDGTIAYKN